MNRVPWVSQVCTQWSYILQRLRVNPQGKSSAPFPVLLRFLPYSHHQKYEKSLLPMFSMVVVCGAEWQSRRLSLPQPNCLTFLPKSFSQIPKNLPERTFSLLLGVHSLLPTSTFPQSVMGRIHLIKCRELVLDIYPWTSHLGLPSWSVEMRTRP